MNEPAQKGRQGQARMRQLAEQDERDRQQIESDLLRDLGHEPSVTERLAIETIAAQATRARRMRAARRQKEAEMAERLVLRGLGKLGIRQGQQKPAGYALQEYLREKYGAPTEAAAPEAPAESEATT
jgi:hypothetical protein